MNIISPGTGMITLPDAEDRTIDLHSSRQSIATWQTDRQTDRYQICRGYYSSPHYEQ